MKISMIITTFNRASLLVTTLNRLRHLTLPDEIIVVDDGSTDGTERCVEACRTQYDLPLRYIYNHNPGPSICSLARNIGVRHAYYPWIITTEPELVWVTDMVAWFRAFHGKHPDSVISAGHIYFQPENWEGAIPLNPQGWMEAIGWVAPYAALYKKSWLEEVGGWDESFPGAWGWDDTDLLTRLRIAGYGQYIARELMAVHQYHELGGDLGSVNEAHFLSKSFIADESRKDDLVANKGKDWGMLRVRND